MSPTKVVIDPTGTPRTMNTGTARAHRTVDPAGMTVDDIVSHEPEGAVVEAPPQFIQGDPQKPDPTIFKLGPEERPATPLHRPLAISEITKRASESVERISGGMIAPAPRRRLTHNEMLEEIMGAHISNQTKFYVVAKLGHREEEEPTSVEGKAAEPLPSNPKRPSRTREPKESAGE